MSYVWYVPSSVPANVSCYSPYIPSSPTNFRLKGQRWYEGKGKVSENKMCDVMFTGLNKAAPYWNIKLIAVMGGITRNSVCVCVQERWGTCQPRALGNRKMRTWEKKSLWITSVPSTALFQLGLFDDACVSGSGNWLVSRRLQFCPIYSKTSRPPQELTEAQLYKIAFFWEHLRRYFG